MILGSARPALNAAKRSSVERKPSDFLTLRRIKPVEIERETPYPIKNQHNEVLVGVLHEPCKPSGTLVIAAHGWRSGKDGPHVKYSCVELARAGCNVYRFDFSGCGQSEGRFEDATPRKLLNDLNSVLEHFRPRYDRIILYGRSMGGLLAIMLAAVRKVEGVVTLAAPMHWEDRFLDQLSPEQREQMLSVGFATVPHSTPYGDVMFTIKDTFLRELKDLHPLEAARLVACPVLVAHGTADTLVPPSDSEELLLALGSKKKDLFLIGGADHRTSNPAHQDALVARMVAWIREH